MSWSRVQTSIALATSRHSSTSRNCPSMSVAMCLTPLINILGLSPPLIAMIRLAMFFARSPMRSISLATQDANDLPKIVGDRLTPRNRLDRPFLDVVLHGIDRGIGGNYPLCATGIASRQRFDRLGNLSLRQPAHLGDCAREFL